jgi:HNH endonuclease
VSVADAATRAAVEQRAEFRCEYCRLPVRGQIATFPIDHPMPRSSGGPTVLANLALA